MSTSFKLCVASLIRRKWMGKLNLLKSIACPCLYPKKKKCCLFGFLLVFVWIHVHYYYYYFFHAFSVFWDNYHYLCNAVTLSMGHIAILFKKKNIKNESHGTIYTFKNYFATVFLVFSFSKNKLYPNGSLVSFLLNIIHLKI